MTAPAALERAAWSAQRQLPPRELEQVRACTLALATVRVGAPPVMQELGGALKELLGADLFGSYVPVRGLDGWEVEQTAWCGLHSEFGFGRALASVMNRSPDDWQPGYDPDRPEVAQRNCALRPLARLSVESLIDTPIFRSIHVPTGTQHFDQLRVLVCEGPALLAWVGGFREEPFTQREQRRLTALVPSLYKRLRVERRLRDADLYGAGLETALEALPVQAFIMRPNGSVAHANTSGRAAYTASLGAALAEGGADGYEATPIVVRGAPAASLVVRSAAARDLGARVSACAKAWQLTRRQSEVLALVVQGDSNKAIAAKLGCTLRTAEMHVTALLRKAGCAGRVELVARLWRGG